MDVQAELDLGIRLEDDEVEEDETEEDDVEEEDDIESWN